MVSVGTEDTKAREGNRTSRQGRAGPWTLGAPRAWEMQLKCPNGQSQRAQHGSESVLGRPSLVCSLHGGHKLGKRRLTLAGFALKRQHPVLTLSTCMLICGKEALKSHALRKAHSHLGGFSLGQGSRSCRMECAPPVDVSSVEWDHIVLTSHQACSLMLGPRFPLILSDAGAGAGTSAFLSRCASSWWLFGCLLVYVPRYGWQQRKVLKVRVPSFSPP